MAAGVPDVAAALTKDAPGTYPVAGGERTGPTAGTPPATANRSWKNSAPLSWAELPIFLPHFVPCVPVPGTGNLRL